MTCILPNFSLKCIHIYIDFCFTSSLIICVLIQQSLHIIHLLLLVPTTPCALNVNLSLDGIFISWNKSHVHHGSIRYELTGRENGVKKVFCVDCGLKYLINKARPNMNYSFWVVAHNIQNGYESRPSSIVHYQTTRSSKYFIH